MTDTTHANVKAPSRWGNSTPKLTYFRASRPVLLSSLRLKVARPGCIHQIALGTARRRRVLGRCGIVGWTGPWAALRGHLQGTSGKMRNKRRNGCNRLDDRVLRLRERQAPCQPPPADPYGHSDGFALASTSECISFHERPWRH